MKKNIKGDFQICISVPLINGYFETHYVYIKSKCSPENDIQIHDTSLIKDFFFRKALQKSKELRIKMINFILFKRQKIAQQGKCMFLPLFQTFCKKEQ